MVVGASSLRPQKAVKTRNGADSKEKLSNPRKVFFFCSVLANLLLWQLRRLLQVHSTGHLSKTSRGSFATRKLAKFGQFVLGDTGYRTRQSGATVNLRRDHIAGHPGCFDLLPLAQTFLRSRFWSRGFYRPLLSHHNNKKTGSVYERGLGTRFMPERLFSCSMPPQGTDWNYDKKLFGLQNVFSTIFSHTDGNRKNFLEPEKFFFTPCTCFESNFCPPRFLNLVNSPRLNCKDSPRTSSVLALNYAVYIYIYTYIMYESNWAEWDYPLVN